MANNHNKTMVSVKEIINKHKVSYQTINHYTNFGLLPVSTKKGNVRFYDKSVVDKRLKMIRALMEEGYSLRLIRKKVIGI